MSESDLVRSILSLPLPSLRLFRNQVGTARVRGQYVTTGLGTGSSDLIGYRTIIVGGKRIAQFVAIEVKDGNKYDPSPEQLRFLEEVRSAGGLAILARSIDDVIEALA